MAYELKITERAEADLDAIVRYLLTELDNQAAAKNLLDEIEKRYTLLEQNPRIYGECEQPLLKRSRFRKIAIHGFLLVYRIDEAQNVVFIERYFSDLQDYANKL
ncbi:MAG: type II toxin-antitoxin system RelE/ParE family toxin [Eubacteriales bacterium]|nr:type II toxin-antitoxin system RelE/ParE family toxin [Eubacteriales bacterium]